MVSLALFFSLLSLVLKYCGPLIESFRGDDTEAFSSGLFFCLSPLLLILNTSGPRLKSRRGDE